MLKAWNVDPIANFKSLGSNAYLVELASEEEVTKVMVGGPWTLRGDLVAVRRVSSHLSLNPDLIKTADLWVQFFNAPINLTDEGIAIMAKQVGSPLSAPVEGFIGGRRFIKVKLSVKLGLPLKDRVRFTHESLGEVSVICSYEKITRVCFYCASLGHEIHSCTDYLRMGQLAQQMGDDGPYDFGLLLKPKYGKWMTNSSLVPRPGSATEPPSPLKKPSTVADSHGPAKRPYSETVPFPETEKSGLESQLPIVCTSDGLSSNPRLSMNQPIKRPKPAGLNPSAMDI